MAIKVTCRDCKKIHRASSRLVGKTVRCPSCSRLLKVAESDATDDPGSPLTPMPMKGSSRGGTYGESRWTWRLIAAGCGVLTLIAATIIIATNAF